LFRAEPHRPLPVRTLQREDPLGVFLNLTAIPLGIDLGQCLRLVAEIHHVLDLHDEGTIFLPLLHGPRV